MSIVQSFLPYDNSTVSHYTTWAQGIGTALSTLGWVKQSDAAGVTWANVTSLTNVPQYGTPLAGTVSYSGAWAAGTTTYTAGNSSTLAAQSTFSVVTDVGLTYANVLATSTTGGGNGIQALQNSTSAAFAISAVASSGGGQTAVYTISGGTFTIASVLGQQFVISVGASNLSANNAGTYICTTAVANTSITLGNANATVQTPTAGATMASSSSVISFINLTNSNSFVGVTNSNQLVGHSLTVAGFTGGATGNNTTYTVTANAQITDISNNGCFAATFTGTNSTQVSPAATVSEATHPASDTLHWMPYNYEIWKSNGSLSSTAPIYMKLVYCTVSSGTSVGNSATANWPGLIMDIGTAYPSVGQIGGNHIGEFLMGFNSSTGVGNTYECDFSGNADEFAMILWRNAAANSTSIPDVLYIDRTKDQNGNTLSTFFTVGYSNSNTSRAQWTLFNAATGGVINYQFTGGNNSGWTTLIAPNTGTGGYAYQGLTPVFPIFPVPGYIANPVLMAVVMKTGDFTDGQLVNAVLYGTSHTFLMSKSLTVDQPQIATGFPGIRWE